MAWSVDLRRRMKASAPWYDRRSVIAVFDLFIGGREGVDIETIRVQKVGQLLTPVNIYSLFEPELRSDLQ